MEEVVENFEIASNVESAVSSDDEYGGGLMEDVDEMIDEGEVEVINLI